MKPLNLYTNLLDGADAGHFELPEEVTDARRVLARIDAAATLHPAPDLARHREDFIGAVVASAVSGAEWPDPADLLAADAAQRAYNEWQIAVREARLVAEQRLHDALIADPDRFITENLRPAHAQAVEVAKTNAALAPLADDPTVTAVLTAGQRSKADALAAAAARYAAVRAAWAALTRVGQHDRNDDQNVFGELHDLPDVWPTYRQRGNDAPWPTKPVARLCWIATHAHPWLPTVTQQEARWSEVYGERLDQANRNRFNLQSFNAIGGGAVR